MTIGERIKFVRKNNNLNQKDFSKRLGISQTHVSKIENNVENPSDTLLRLIALEFNVSTEWLEKGDGNADINSTFDYYQRNDPGVTLQTVEIINTLSKEVMKLNYPPISDMLYYPIELLCNRINDDPTDVLILESVLNFFVDFLDITANINSDTTIEKFKMLKSECIDSLYDKLKGIESIIKVKDSQE